MLQACQGPLSAIDPAGPSASAVAELWWIMLAGAALLAALVFVLLAMALLRRRQAEPARASEPASEPRRASASMSARDFAAETRDDASRERFWIVWLGLAMPCAVLAVLLVYALVLGGRTLPTPSPDRVTIAAESRRFAWVFSHPGGQRIDGVMHIPAGRAVDVSITATDVIHSFWVPRLAGKMDAIPGHTNVLRLVASEPGTYRGECAEYCGIGHRDHGFTVIAHDAAGWAAFEGGRP